MTILAIDTSTQWCSVALVNPQGGSGQPQSPLSCLDLVRHENLGPESSQHALDWVEALLEEVGEMMSDNISPSASTVDPNVCYLVFQIYSVQCPIEIILFFPYLEVAPPSRNFVF